MTIGSRDPAGHDIVVNATPLGTTEGDPLPLDVARIDPAAFVGEVVMKQEMTPFLAAAAARGCAVQVGTDMLFEQIPVYLESFGLPAAVEELRQVAQIRYWPASERLSRGGPRRRRRPAPRPPRCCRCAAS